MKPLGSPLRDRRSATLLVAGVAMLVYANSLANQFAYDDVHIIVNNPSIQSLRELPSTLWAPYWPGLFGREQAIWRPVTTAVLATLYAIGGGAAFVFHAANILAHAAASVLVLYLCAALMPLPASFVAGLVFAVHPVHVEAVSNVIGIAEILSTIAVLVACLVHLRGPDRSGWREAVLIGGLYALAFGSKESGVTLPALIFLLDAARRRIAFNDLGAYARDRWPVYAAMLIVAGAILACRVAILGSVATPLGPLGADLLEEVPHVWTLGEVWMHYVRLWIFPMDLSADYSPNVIPIAIGWNSQNVVGVVLVVAILVMALVAWRRPYMSPDRSTSRSATFGVLWFMISISPIANVLFLSGVLLAERTLYLPSVGLALATGWLVTRLAERRPRLVPAAVGALLILGAARTWTRTPVWRDNTATFVTLLRDYPQSGRSQWIIGDQYFGTGHVSQALLSYRAAISLLGGQYQLITEIGFKLLQLKRYDAAETLLRFAWNERPEFGVAPGLVASIRSQMGDPEGTELWARRALSANPNDGVRHQLLAWALAARGRLPEAEEERAKVKNAALDQMWQQWSYQAYVRRADGDIPGAVAAVDSAWVLVSAGVGKATVDSIRVADFGLAPLGNGVEDSEMP